MQIELAAVKTLAKRRRRVTRLFSRSEEPQLQPQCKRNIGTVRPQRCAIDRGNWFCNKRRHRRVHLASKTKHPRNRASSLQ